MELEHGQIKKLLSLGWEGRIYIYTRVFAPRLFALLALSH
jgi:hypothetical protein